MKKVFGILAIGLVAMSFMASSDKSTKQEDQGIKFKSISLADAKKQALKNEKYIFIDAHTSWCGPCKKMAATSFKNAEVGAVFNEKFINLKIDVEQDADGARLLVQLKINLVRF